ncbi:hypothetical protein [Streptomyces fragilis]|uniref:Transposase n=1 Tax=Streptomyces fragilis TaxID=67301 RepID=A0ABV2YKS6_9ACTN|nr:hypothetical protein [Streptomyces fragilis]
MDLDAVAQELYGTLPETITRMRDERAARARAEGDRELAKRIKALRKPTLSAWACNLLVRERKEETEPLLRLGEALRQAHLDLDGGVLRDLSRQQHLLVSALARQAVELTAAAGHRVGEGAREEVEGTLRAVLADPGAAAAWAEGRLTGPLTATPGFGAVPAGGTPPDLRLVPAPKRDAAGAEPQAGPAAGEGGATTARRGEGGAPDAGGATQGVGAAERECRAREREAAEREAAEREAAEREAARRQAAERARRRELAEARAEAEEAARALGEAEEETAGADRAEREAVDRVAALEERVRGLEEELHAARAETREARAAERAARDRARAAARTLRDARHRATTAETRAARATRPADDA